MHGIIVEDEVYKTPKEKESKDGKQETTPKNVKNV